MKHLRVSRKLTLAFASVLFVVIAFCSVAFVSMQRIHEATLANQQTQSVLKLSSQILATLVEHQNAMRGFVASLNEEFIERMAKYGDAVPPLMTELEQKLSKTEAETYLPPARQAIQTFYAQLDATVANARDPATIEETRSKIATTARLSDIRKALTALDEASQKVADERTASLNAAFETGTKTLIAGGADRCPHRRCHGHPPDTQPRNPASRHDCRHAQAG